MMNKTILLNGAIRDTEEFYLIADFIFAKMREHGAKVDFVISTWHEDIQANQALFAWLHREGARIVGSPSLDEGGPANVYRQWRTLEAGLSHVDEGNIVLKGRTDKFLLHKSAIEAFIQAPGDSPALMGLLDSGKLALEHISVSLPFMAKDMVYLGSVAAMREICHFSVRTRYCADHIFNGIGPECFLWLEYARTSQAVMRIIQYTDLRALSNRILADGTFDTFDWSQLEPSHRTLFEHWLAIIEQKFTFVSVVLDCPPVAPWVIDEGSWRYQIGGPAEYEVLRTKLSATASAAGPASPTRTFLNSTREYSFEDLALAPPTPPFPKMLDQIRESKDREFSDIVLIRKSVIEAALAHEPVERADVVRALHWNIRQRDRETLQQAYDWLITRSPHVALLSESDQAFVIERMVDFFNFSDNQAAIAKTIETLPHLFQRTVSLRIRLAEHHFRRQERLKALYWFYQSQAADPNGLGANHGLGCTLLDLRLPALALRYLYKAHTIAPSDQTATFTLIRALSATGRKKEGLSLLQSLNGHLRVEAEKVLLV